LSRTRQVSVTREGWYYLFILTFIVGGAVMRQINPLFALAGLMIAPLLFNWRFSMASLRDIRIQRRVPRRIAAGEPLVVDLTISNERARLDAWQLRVIDDVRWQGTTRSRSHEVEALVPAVAAGGSVRTSYRCQLYRRGVYTIGSADVRCAYPFGLLSFRSTLESQSELLVSPRIGHLRTRWQQLVHSQRMGGQSARNRRGATDGDFYSLRQYRNGDSRRWIHWRTSAKLGELMVQQFDESTDHHITLLFDFWEPGQLTPTDLDAVEIAASFAATAAVDICLGSGGKLTLSVAADPPFFHTGAPSKPLLNTVLDYLATARPTVDSHPLEHWMEAGASGTRGGKILLISTRPKELLDEALNSPHPTLPHLPDWVTKLDRISVRDPEFLEWFSITPDPTAPLLANSGTE
jgi:uncharacterized protein (DUF58 family)